jgi:uroporphyrinogen decarboxylase
MTSREVVLQAIERGMPPRNAVALLSGGLWTFQHHGLTLQEVIGKPELAAEIISETSDLLESDIVWVGTGYYQLLSKALGGPIKFRKNGVPDIVAPLFESVAEIDGIDLDRIDSDDDLNYLWQTGRLVSRMIGRRYLVGAGMFAPFTVAAHFYGVEKIMRGIYKDKAGLHRVLEFASEACFRFVKPFVDAGVEIVSVADPTASGDTISRKQYREFAFPYEKAFIARLHDLGAKTLLHMCGDTSQRLDLLVDTGTDVISIDYKVELENARQAV